MLHFRFNTGLNLKLVKSVCFVKLCPIKYLDAFTERFFQALHDCAYTVSKSIKIKLRTTLFTLNYVWHFIFAVSFNTFSNSIEVTYFKTTFKQIRIFVGKLRLEVMSASNVFYSCFAGNIKGIHINYLETYRNRFSNSSAILFLICIRYIDFNYTASVYI